MALAPGAVVQAGLCLEAPDLKDKKVGPNINPPYLLHHTVHRSHSGWHEGSGWGWGWHCLCGWPGASGAFGCCPDWPRVIRTLVHARYGGRCTTSQALPWTVLMTSARKGTANPLPSWDSSSHFRIRGPWPKGVPPVTFDMMSSVHAVHVIAARVHSPCHTTCESTSAMARSQSEKAAGVCANCCHSRGQHHFPARALPNSIIYPNT